MASIRRSKVTLPFSLICSVDFFMLSPQIWAAFLALIPPSFTFLNPFMKSCSDLCNPILTVTTRESMRIPGSTPTHPVIYRKCSYEKQAVHTSQVASEWVKKISIRGWVELHFTTISYILSLNYSYRYEINLIRIMYTANSSILYSKEKTVRILGTWHQYLVNVSGLCYSKQIEFQEELINFLKTWLL